MDLRRGISPATIDAISRPFNAILMAHLDWPDAPVYAHTGVGPITWGGNTFRGVGPLGGVDIPPEAMGGIVAVEAILSLVGVPADLDGLADDNIRGRMVRVWFACVAGRPGGRDGAQIGGLGNMLIGEPVPLFSGTMDGLSLDAQDNGMGVDHSASLSVSTGPGARSVASLEHSDEDQRKKHAGDTAGRLVILAWANAQRTQWPQN